MNTHVKNLFLLPALITGLGVMPAVRVTAQTFMTRYSFAYNDGINPQAGLVLSGNTLFGTTSAGANSGGVNGQGTVFSVLTNGTNFTVVYGFTACASPYFDTNSDGAEPQAGLIVSGNTLYGTAAYGGTNGAGTVFSVLTNGTNFTVLHTFSGGNDGGGPYAGLILSGSTLYGTAEYGGSSNYGTVFSVTTNGTNFTTLYSFTNGSDGAVPLAGLVLAGNTLYGTTSGGDNGYGSVFAINTDGSNFTTLHDFTANSGYPSYTNSDGNNPEAGLILSGNTLYGTTSGGGTNGAGTVFAVNTNRMGFTNLYDFTATSNSTNSDGADPYGGLILSGNTLYGTAYNGGLSSGTIFAVKTNGTGFTNLYSFTLDDVYPYANSDGAHPKAGLILSDNTLYGTAYGGGNEGGFTGYGTVFSLSLGMGSVNPPQLAIMLSGPNVILTWTNTASGFTLQSTTNLLPAAWSTNLPAPVVINGQYTVTNPITGTQQFYELSQ
jgi:uncharacterized repeat protein (TIGR03803 family)